MNQNCSEIMEVKEDLTKLVLAPEGAERSLQSNWKIPENQYFVEMSQVTEQRIYIDIDTNTNTDTDTDTDICEKINKEQETEFVNDSCFSEETDVEHQSNIVSYTIPKHLKIIRWDKIMETIGDDYTFVQEVLDDLIQEAMEAECKIRSGIQIQDFFCIQKAAHRVKGSASYLFCERLQNVSFQIQQITTTENTFCNIHTQIQCLFEIFQICVVELKKAIEIREPFTPPG